MDTVTGQRELTPLGRFLEYLLAFHERQLLDRERQESSDELSQTVPAGVLGAREHSSFGGTLFSSYYPVLTSESAPEPDTGGSIPQADIQRAWQALCLSALGKSIPLKNP
jgi:hypothetical protein